MNFLSRTCPRRFFLGSLFLSAKTVVTYYEDVGQRTEEVFALAAMLRGEPHRFRKLVAFGELWGYRKLVDLLSAVCQIPEAQAAQLLKATAAILCAEDAHGNHLDVWEKPEVGAQWLEEKTALELPISSSFGLGQIKAPTALRVVRSHMSRLAVHLPVLAERVSRLSQNPSRAGIVSATDLLGDGNVIISALVLFEAFSAYRGSYTGSTVTGAPEQFDLAAAAYFCGVTAPAVAKLQLVYNHLASARSVTARVSIDGSLGTGTVQAFHQLGDWCGIHLAPLEKPFREPADPMFVIAALGTLYQLLGSPKLPGSSTQMLRFGGVVPTAVGSAWRLGDRPDPCGKVRLARKFYA